jgi:phospholipase D1/2
MSRTILQPGRNCWRIERAHRFYMIQDAAEYFRLVRRTLPQARRTVFSLGWDITGSIDLDPEGPSGRIPKRLDKLVAHVARRQRQLHVYILTWDYGLLFTLERDPFTRFRFRWGMPRRVHFAFDDSHPVGASHHQKIVVIDDSLGFCGGIDLTGHRWDTPAHRPDEPHRVTPTGTVYGPYHEVQAMVDGPVAAALGELARQRWRATGAEDLPAVVPAPAAAWPDDVVPDLEDVQVGISRTIPESSTSAAVRECEALFLDSIAAARHSIYIENQYFTHFGMTDALVARLAEPNGPEVVIAVPRDSHGWLEQQTIGAIRDNLFRRLLASDPHKRLRIVAPVASRARDAATFVHSKVMIVDDSLIRIGSANCTHRSMGMDTECDLTVEANGDPRIAAGIRRLRDRLIGEHLCIEPDGVGPAIERFGCLCGLVDDCDSHERTLVRVPLAPEPLEMPSEAVRMTADPDEPLSLEDAMKSMTPTLDSSHPGVRLWRMRIGSVGREMRKQLRRLPLLNRVLAPVSARGNRLEFD